MLLEASHLAKGAVVDVQEVGCGRIDRCVFVADPGALFGFQVATGSVVSRFRSLELADVISLNRDHAVVDSAAVLGKNLKELDALASATGPIIGVVAKSESGRRIGTVTDLLLDADTGLIVRFYVRNLLNERIIPREYLVAITPKQIVFKDVVTTPIFNQVAASAEAAAG